MPPKVYLDAPPNGDFRAMPARGGGLALLKWVTSFPGNPARGLPTVTGVICLSDAVSGEPLMLLDARSVTALRTGAVAAVAARAVARPGARTGGIVGCGLHGAWTARALAAAGYGPGVCHDPDEARAFALAREVGGAAGGLADALGAEVVAWGTAGRAGGGGRGGGAGGPRAGARGGRPAARNAPRHARRRRPGQGRGDPGGGRVVRAVLRRVGAGVPRRRADAGGAGGPGGPRPRDRPGRGAGRRSTRKSGPGRGDPLRQHRPGDPGPGDRPGRLRSMESGEGGGPDGPALELMPTPSAACALPAAPRTAAVRSRRLPSAASSPYARTRPRPHRWRTSPPRSHGGRCPSPPPTG